LPAVAGSQGPVCRRLETSLRPTRLFVSAVPLDGVQRFVGNDMAAKLQGICGRIPESRKAKKEADGRR
jgi:hypothetical protein